MKRCETEKNYRLYTWTEIDITGGFNQWIRMQNDTNNEGHP